MPPTLVTRVMVMSSDFRKFFRAAVVNGYLLPLQIGGGNVFDSRLSVCLLA